MRRSQAADLIDRIRQLAETQTEGMNGLRTLLLSAGLKPLQPCSGEVHKNAHIDNCNECVPRWGFVGKKEPVT